MALGTKSFGKQPTQFEVERDDEGFIHIEIVGDQTGLKSFRIDEQCGDEDDITFAKHVIEAVNEILAQ